MSAKVDNYIYKDKTINIGGKDVVFNNRIEQVIVDDGKIYILLSIPLNQETYSYDDDHNIYCYSYYGELLWQVGTHNYNVDAMFVGIDEKNGSLYGTDFMGRRFHIDKSNGKLLDMREVR
jgi:hypothetical protein